VVACTLRFYFQWSLSNLVGQAKFDGETGNIFWQDIATEFATVFQQKNTLLGKHVIHINTHFTFYTRKSQNLNWGNITL